MNKTLKELESQRKTLYAQLEKTGDFRRGIISVNYRKCGKKNCICAKSQHPGHGPQYLWNTTIKGKSYARNVKLGPALEKYMEEIANYRGFLEICDEIVKVNEKICDLRPIAKIEDQNEAEELKKKLRKLLNRK
jgi:hypothetical protein